MVSFYPGSDRTARLIAVAAETGKPRVFRIEEALTAYLEELKDLALVEQAMRDDDPAQNTGHEDMKWQPRPGNHATRPRLRLIK